MFRDGIHAILNTTDEVEVVGHANDGEELLHLLPDCQADIVLLDLNMPKLNGIEATGLIQQRFPGTKVLIVSMSSSVAHVTACIKAGANGYVMKNTGKGELLTALKQIHEGGEYFSDEINKIIRHGLKTQDQEGAIRFTPRELDVLRLICKGHTTTEIADALFISINTVDTHRKNLFSKTGCRNAVALVNFAYDNSVVDR